MREPSRHDLLSVLNAIGDFTALKFIVDPAHIAQDLAPFANAWRPYNEYKRGIARSGLSLTSLDGEPDNNLDLASLREHALHTGRVYEEGDFNRPTEIFRQMHALRPLLSDFLPNIGRTHLIRLDQGGFFPPHRDEPCLVPESFRIFVPAVNCEARKFVFLLEDKVVPLEPGRAYFVNTRREHAVFSFVDNCVMLVMNVPLTPANVERTLASLAAC